MGTACSVLDALKSTARGDVAYSVYDQQPIIARRDTSKSKRLGAALRVIGAMQDSRDAARLASPKGSLRGKRRIRDVRSTSSRQADPEPARLLPRVNVSPPVSECLARFRRNSG